MKSLGLPRNHVRALFALLLLLGFSVSAEPAKNTEEKRLLFVPSSRRTPPRRDSQLLVSLANGNLVALDQETGEALWTFETGLPLVSATPPSGEAGVEEVNNGEDTKPKDSIFPGIDGSLYAYRPSHGSDGSRIEKLPVTVSELVQQSPAPTQDGSLMMGSQHTTVFLIDGASGQLLRTFYDFDGELAQLRSATAASLGLPEESEVDLSNAVVIGRKDYVVRSVHPEFGEQWNVTWSRVQRLSELEVVRPPATDAAGISLATPAAGSEAQQHQQQLPSVVGLVVGPDFSLRSFDPGSGWERWTHRFDAVPIAAYSAAGRRLDLLDPGQRRALEVGGGGGDGGGGGVREERKELPKSHASTALQPLPRQRPPVGGVDGSALPGVQPGEGGGMLSPEMCSPGRGDEVLVGLMGGSLFGVPATHFTFDVSQQLCQVDTSGAADPGASTPLPALPSTQHPYQPRRDDLEEVQGGGPSPAPPPDSPSVAVAIPGDGPDVDAQCDSSDPAAKCSVPLGMYRLSKAGSTPGGRAGMMLLPASANESAEREARRAQQDMAGASAGGGGGRRVTLVVAGAMGGSVAVLVVVVVVVRGRGERGQQPLQAGTAHGVGVELSGASGGEEGLPLLAEGRGEAGRGGKGSRRKAGGLRAKHLSNRVKGHLLQQLAEGGEGEEEGRGGSSGSASRSATQGEEGGQTGGGGAVGAAGGEGGGGGGGGEGLQGVDRQDSLSPSSAAVQRGMQDTSMQRRQVRDGKVCVGRLQVGPAILGYGSGGTVVFEGEMDGRPVAVKRMLRQFYELAKKEIGALILSDEHPNVVRVFGLEEDHEFCYLALERCKGTLAEAMQDPASRSMFVDQEGLPTPLALRVARDVGRGLEALHDRDIVHRDLKPHNVLMTEGGRAKLSDMGLSKRLVPEQSSFESVGSGGSSGWQAPEQLVSRSGGSARQTRSVDVFSYGLLVHYCLTGGAHPFGESYERDANILMGRSTMKHLQQQPLAADLVQGMVAAAPGARPSVASVMCHPLWWDVPRRLAFLIDVSDRVEGEDRAEDRSMYMSLETLVEAAVGPGRSWAAAMDSGLVNNLGKYRRYNYGSLRDLLRVIRNKHNHFRELPPELQNKLGPLPEGFLAYFEKRYPGLLSTCFYFALRWCAEEPVFQKYFSPASQTLLEKLAPRELRQELPAAQHAKRAAADAPAPPPSLPVVVEEGEGEREGGRGERGRRDKAVAVEAAAAAVPARPKMNGALRAKPSAEVSEFGNRSRSRSPSPSPLAAAAALPTPPQARLPAAGAQAGVQPPEASADAVTRGQAADLDAADSPPDSPPIYIPSPLTASGGSSDTDSPVSPLPLRSTPSPPPPDISPSGSPKSIRGAGDALPSSPLASPGSDGSVSLRRISTGRSPTPSSTANQEPPPADNGASGAVTSAFAAAAAAPGFDSDSDSDCDPGSRANGDTPPRPSHSRDDSLGITLPASPLIGGTPKTWSGGYEAPPPHHDLVRQATDTLASAASLSHMVPAPGRALSGALTGALSLWSSGVLPDSAAAGNTGGGGEGGGFTLSPPRPHPGRSLSRQSPTAMPVFGKRGPATLEPQLPQEDVSPVRLEKDGHLLVAMFPRRPGHPVCDFFMKTGHCKFGEMCKFDHPPNYAVRLNQAGLPVRPGEPTCSFYQRYGGCKFGASCKFNHPPAHPTPQQ